MIPNLQRKNLIIANKKVHLEFQFEYNHMQCLNPTY